MNTYIEILIDNSNSMGRCEELKNFEDYLLPDGSTRMELSKRILINEILPTLDYAKEINITLFHGRNDNGLLIETPIYKGANNVTLKQKIQDIAIPTKTGGTPITDAVKASIKRLKDFSQTDRKIILVTDGEETGKKNYRIATKNALRSYGIPVNIFIIGIALNKTAEAKAKNLAIETNGQFVSFQNNNYNSINIASKISSFKNSIIHNSITKVTQKPEIQKLENKNQKIETETENSKLITIEKNISNHNKLLLLISKQINILQDEISGLRKKETNYDDENLIIYENKELNNKVGRISEKLVYEKLKEQFGNEVVWENINDESGKSYDFKIIKKTDNSINYFIECKGTINDEKVFFLTKNEWKLFLDNKDKYQIYLVNNVLSNPKITIIDNLLNWILNGKVVPYPLRNRKIKAERIILTIQ